ncbi:hypothetical protein Pla175_46920 [Pirellulimonas nuda]|uniref:Legionella pneumophila major outer membrane protein n=1 Tax=Pirellulimonas nuda TaxID=2528009 RepID=A0A518DIF9_9BACT|nr:Lpg1974 family pore-forming outer membrane protein [Pirellulimonas nuda]QDU91271.1 hypothetical protein Pla175_46920 [Pirellulimonas nuda]
MSISLAGAGARRLLLSGLLAALAVPASAGDIAQAFEFGGAPQIRQTAGGYAVRDEQCLDPNVQMAQCQSCPMNYDQGMSYDQGMGCESYMDCGEGVCCGDPCCMPCCPPPAKRSFVFGEFLMLRPTDGDVAHAQQQDGLGGAGTVPFGTIGTADIEYAPGFRVGGGVCVGPCSAITASYTWFESNDSSALTVPNIAGGGGAVGSLVQHPGAALTASTGPVTANYGVDFQLADVMFRDVLLSKSWCELNYSVGAQYGNIEQDFMQNGAFGGGGAGAKETRTNIEFHGGGIKAGLDGERFLARGLRVYGKLNGSLMSGRFNTSYRLQNTSTTADLAMADWKDNRAISLVECELGVAKVCCDDRIRVSAGYLFQQWGNLVTTSDFIQGVRNDNYTDLSDSLRLDGFTVRAEARW